MNDEELMRMAIAEAKLAEEHGDIPIGAIVVINDEVLSRDIMNVSYKMTLRHTQKCSLSEMLQKH